MESIDFREQRRLLDDAITFADFPLARKLAEEALRSARDQEWMGEIMYFTAQLEIIEEDYNEAIKFLDLAVRYNPCDGAAYNDRALCMVELGMIDSAFPYFDKGIEVEPDYATVYHNKGWLMNKVGQHQEAIGYFHKTLELEPKRAVTYENLGNAYTNLGRKHDAIKAYQKAISLLASAHLDIRCQIEDHIKDLGTPDSLDNRI